MRRFSEDPRITMSAAERLRDYAQQAEDIEAVEWLSAVERPSDVTDTVFDPTSETFGPIMAALQAGDFERASFLVDRLCGSPTGITWSGEACENFAEQVNQMDDWYVQITPLEDEDPFDAVIRAPIIDIGWYDAVTFVRADPRDGTPLDGAEVETIRVRKVHIY